MKVILMDASGYTNTSYYRVIYVFFFEKLVDPFPSGQPEKPPQGLYQFCRYYTRV